MNKSISRARLVRAILTSALLVPLLLWVSGCWLMNVPPTAAFTISSQAGQAPFAVNFSAVLSEDEDGVIVQYQWDFGDGSSGSGENVTHTFTDAGTFTIVLRVTDDDGETGTTNKTIYVSPAEPPGPSAAFTRSPSSGTSPLTVFFDASSSTYDSGVISQYEWDFGNGRTGFGRTTSHTYFSTGAQTYTVTLTVRGSDGKTGVVTNTVSISGTGGGDDGGDREAGDPSARFEIVSDNAQDAAGDTGVAPFNALFDPEDTEVDEGQALLQIVWSFGDGDSESTANLIEQWHVYTTSDASEVFSITLLAMDDDARTDTITKTVKVYNHQPVAGFEVCNPAGGHTAGDDGTEDYANEAAAIAADRWDDDDDEDGIIIGDLQELDGAPVNVFIRSQISPDMLADWFDLDGSQLQDDLEMAEGVDAAPGSTKPEPNDWDDFENAFSYDPEGQGWIDQGANNDYTDDFPAWFPAATGQAWGIQYIYVDWDDGGPEERFDYLDETDADGWPGTTERPAYDQDFVASHAYDFTGGTVTKTITIRVVDFLGGQDTFSRDIILMEGTEGSDDLDP